MPEAVIQSGQELKDKRFVLLSAGFHPVGSPEWQSLRHRLDVKAALLYWSRNRQRINAGI